MIAHSSKDIHRAKILMRLVTFSIIGACGVVLLLIEDQRYAVLWIILVLGIIGISLVEDKTRFLGWMMVFAICLRVVNANIGKQIPFLENAYPKVNIFEVILFSTVVVLFLSSMLRIKPLRFPPLLGNKVFLGLVAINLFSFLFITPSREFGLDRLVTLVEMYLLYIVIYNICESEKDVVTVVKVLIGTIAVQSILVFSEILLGNASLLARFFGGDSVGTIDEMGVIAGRRVAGSFGESVNFAWTVGFLFFMIFPFGFLAFVSEEKLRRNARWSLVACFLFALLTMTRTVLISQLVFGIVGFYLLGRYHHRKLFKWIPKIIFTASITVGIVSLLPGARDIILQRSSDMQELSGSLEFRLISLTVGLRVVENFPLLGRGIGTGGILAFRSNMLDDYVQSKQEIDVISYAGIHNGHAVVFAETGIIGYLAYLSLFLIFAWHAYTLLRERTSILATSFGVSGIMFILYYLLSDFTYVSMVIKAPMMYVALAFGLISRVATLTTERPLESPNRQ